MSLGRPTKFNPARAKSIIEAIAKLAPYTAIAEAHQIDRSTLYDWIQKGFEDLKEVNKTALARFSYTLKKQSRAWILERRFSTEFAIGAHELTVLRHEIDEIKKALKDG